MWCKPAVCLAVSLLAMCTSTSDESTPPKTRSTKPGAGPVIRQPVAPQSREAPRDKDLTPAPTWKEGDPVRVRPDLRESSPPPLPPQKN